jgi:hypothetical protein
MQMSRSILVAGGAGYNACGADPDGQIGEAHELETHLIPLRRILEDHPHRAEFLACGGSCRGNRG